MKAASIFGIILIVVGIFALAYFASPMRLMVQGVLPHKTNLVPPIFGGVALICGLVLLFATRPRR
jgi:hypothetical protein